MTVSEFISVEGLTRNNPKSRRQMRFYENERPFAVQIFGGQPERMRMAAEMAEEIGADILDINCRGLRDGLISKSQHDAIMRALELKKTPPQNTALGGDIYIHGHGASSDWTWGCVALENDDIRELFNAVSVGTPVTILP